MNRHPNPLNARIPQLYFRRRYPVARCGGVGWIAHQEAFQVRNHNEKLSGRSSLHPVWRSLTCLV
jgi:hypothetical protein